MKTNKLNLSLFLALVIALSVMTVSAVTVITPANSATISGTAILNASNSSFATMTNCTFYALSSLTANSSWTTLGTFSNNTALTSINGTFNSTVLEDANNYQFNATCRNITNDISSTAGTASVIIDNTVPDAATSLSPTDSSTDTDGIINYSGTVTGRVTTSCTLLFDGTNPGATSYAMTHSGSTCSYTMSGIPEQIYRWYIRASDETNTTDSSIFTVEISEPSGTSKIKALEELENQQQEQERARALAVSGGKGKSSGMTGIIILVAILVAVVLFVRSRR